MKLKLSIILAAVFLLAVGTVPVGAAGIPTLPQAFYGTVTINGNPAPVNTRIEARGTNVLTGLSGNPISTSDPGNYGSPDASVPNLVAQGNIAEDTAIHFYINGVAADQTAAWHSGALTRVDLTVIINASTGGSTTATTTTTTATQSIQPVKIIIDGEETILPVNQATENTWTVLTAVSENSADGQVEMVIPKDTVITLPSGEELTEISVAPEPEVDLPEPPTDAVIIGTAYNCEPSGASFAPPIELKFHYNYEGNNETELKVAFFNTATGAWIVVPCTVDPETNTVTALVDHFTNFAVIAPLPSTTSPTTTATSTQTSPVATASQTTVIPTSGTSTSPSTTSPSTPAATTPVTTDGPASFNWLLVVIVVAAVIVMLVVIFTMVSRKRSARN